MLFRSHFCGSVEKVHPKTGLSKLLKSKQTMMNNTINETKNTPEGINSRITEAEERISDLEDKIVEITTEEQTEEKRMKRIEDSLRDFWDHIIYTNI